MQRALAHFICDEFASFVFVLRTLINIPSCSVGLVKVLDTDGSGKIDNHELKAVVIAFYEWQELRVDDARITADVAVTRRFPYLLT